MKIQWKPASTQTVGSFIRPVCQRQASAWTALGTAPEQRAGEQKGNNHCTAKDGSICEGENKQRALRAVSCLTSPKGVGAHALVSCFSPDSLSFWWARCNVSKHPLCQGIRTAPALLCTLNVKPCSDGSSGLEGASQIIHLILCTQAGPFNPTGTFPAFLEGSGGHSPFPVRCSKQSQGSLIPTASAFRELVLLIHCE